MSLSSFIKCSKCGGSYAGLRCPHCHESVMQAEAKARNSTGQIDPPHLQFDSAMAKPEPLKKYVEALAGKPKRSMEPPKLNKTEQRWQEAHPTHVPFPLRLRWGKCMNYSPDFLALEGRESKPILIEIKGGHIRDRDIVRFKGCAAEWGWLFKFELHRWKNGKWEQLL